MNLQEQLTTPCSDEIDLSIVIVSWNTREVLRDCLKSVFSGLAELRAEVFVVDNASGDESAEMVKSDFPQAYLIENEENLGFAKANNQAIRKARGRHILLLNSDTVVLRDVLPRSVTYMDKTPFVGVMGCRVLNSDGSVQLTCSRYPTLLNLLLLTTGLYRCSGSRFLVATKCVTGNVTPKERSTRLPGVTCSFDEQRLCKLAYSTSLSFSTARKQIGVADFKMPDGHFEWPRWVRLFTTGASAVASAIIGGT